MRSWTSHGLWYRGKHSEMLGGTVVNESGGGDEDSWPQ